MPACHAPHQSENKKLLIKPEGKLCFECHEESPATVAKAKVKHQPAENGECSFLPQPRTSRTTRSCCSSPTASSAPSATRTSQQQLAKAKVKHQPAENGECSFLPQPPPVGQQEAAVKPEGKLCVECHEDIQQQIAKAKVKHQPAENGECSSCHSPAPVGQQEAPDQARRASSASSATRTSSSRLAKAKVKHQPAENGECSFLPQPPPVGQQEAPDQARRASSASSATRTPAADRQGQGQTSAGRERRMRFLPQPPPVGQQEAADQARGQALLRVPRGPAASRSPRPSPSISRPRQWRLRRVS